MASFLAFLLAVSSAAPRLLACVLLLVGLRPALLYCAPPAARVISCPCPVLVCSVLAENFYKGEADDVSIFRVALTDAQAAAVCEWTLAALLCLDPLGPWICALPSFTLSASRHLAR